MITPTVVGAGTACPFSWDELTSVMPRSVALGPHEPPADIDWALAGVASPVKASRAAPAMDTSLRIQSSNKIRGCRALQRGDGLASTTNLGVSPRRRALNPTSRFPSSDRPTRTPTLDRGRGV